MNILSVDWGEKKVGLAVSLNSSLVQPLKIIYYSDQKKLFIAIEEVIERFKIEIIVMGLPIGLDFKDSAVLQKIRDFGEVLGNFLDLQVIFVNEVMSTKEAQKIVGPDKENDHVAAAATLQSYLDIQQAKEK